MQGRLAAAICLTTIVVECQTPLPSLPPPGPVTTADEAIRIAINVCDPGEAGGRDVASWSAHREGNQWIASFVPHPRQPDALRASVEIHPEDGTASECLIQGTITLH